MSFRARFAIVLTAAAYLAASALPCPPSADELRAAGDVALAASSAGEREPQRAEGHAHHTARAEVAASHGPDAHPAAHHHGDHSGPREAAKPERVASELNITAPCPCGCGKHAASSGPGQRLGPVLVSGHEPDAPAFDREYVALRPLGVREPPAGLPDPIPITA